MPTTALASTVLSRLAHLYGSARDPDKAVAMVAYVRGQFPYLGIPAPVQRTLAREVLAGLTPPAEADLRDIALACWQLPEREYHYFACQLLRRYVAICSADFIVTAKELLADKPWWDTVDPLASRVVGPLVVRHPSLVATMDAWSVDQDMWLVRTAILQQLFYHDATDEERLFRYCAAQARHPDFFIRKAIGWALREYGKTDPTAVRAFVDAHRSELSGLSIREGTRRL
jgi:3-methyladenine DNA glycosylase AlkD